MSKLSLRISRKGLWFVPRADKLAADYSELTSPSVMGGSAKPVFPPFHPPVTVTRKDGHSITITKLFHFSPKFFSQTGCVCDQSVHGGDTTGLFFCNFCSWRPHLLWKWNSPCFQGRKIQALLRQYMFPMGKSVNNIAYFFMKWEDKLEYHYNILK